MLCSQAFADANVWTLWLSIADRVREHTRATSLGRGEFRLRPVFAASLRKAGESSKSRSCSAVCCRLRPIFFLTAWSTRKPEKGSLMLVEHRLHALNSVL